MKIDYVFAIQKLAQLSSTTNVFTSVLLGLAYFTVSVSLVWYQLLASIKLLENKTFKTVLTQDSRKTCTWTVDDANTLLSAVP